jgi:hypothetical protein
VDGGTSEPSPARSPRSGRACRRITVSSEKSSVAGRVAEGPYYRLSSENNTTSRAGTGHCFINPCKKRRGRRVPAVATDSSDKVRI